MEHLNSEESWNKFIKSVETSFDELETNSERIKRQLKQRFTEVIEGINEFGILFSGGLDSSLLALLSKHLNKKFTCYVVGTENSEDVDYAKKVASSLNLKLKIKILTDKEIIENIKNVMKIIKDNDYTKVSVGLVVYSAIKFAKENNEKILLTGLGSEEIFAGYQRHLKNSLKDVHEECFRGLRQDIWRKDITRDKLIADHFKIKIICPFLDKEIIKIAMKLHPMFKINKETKKIILRELAEDSGLEKEFAFRNRRAGQYGSGFDKVIERLTKESNLKFKKEFIEKITDTL